MYRVTVWLIVAVFVFGGTVLGAWSTAPLAPTLNATDHHGAGAVAGYGEYADHLGKEVVASILDRAQVPECDSHLKCCDICNVVSLIPETAATSITISYTAAVFYIAQTNLEGHLVALDPDIPKTSV